MVKKFTVFSIVSLFALLLITYAYGDPTNDPNPSRGKANQSSSRGKTGAENSCPGLERAKALVGPQAAAQIDSELISHGCCAALLAALANAIISKAPTEEILCQLQAQGCSIDPHDLVQALVDAGLDIEAALSAAQATVAQAILCLRLAPPRDAKKPIVLKGKLATSWVQIKSKY